MDYIQQQKRKYNHERLFENGGKLQVHIMTYMENKVLNIYACKHYTNIENLYIQNIKTYI